jgi:hypothetical protein
VPDDDILVERFEANFKAFLNNWTRTLPLFAILAYALYAGDTQGKFLGFEFSLRPLAVLLVFVFVGLFLVSSRCLLSMLHLLTQASDVKRLLFYAQNHPAALNPFLGKQSFGLEVIPNPSRDSFVGWRNLGVRVARGFAFVLPFSGLIGLSLSITFCTHAINLVLDPGYYTGAERASDLVTILVSIPLFLSIVAFITILFRAIQQISQDDFAQRYWILGLSFLLANVAAWIVLSRSRVVNVPAQSIPVMW